jgi:hypothetical protein
LRTRSDARVLTNQDFTYIRQDIDQYQKTEGEHTVTLNERAAIKERQEQAAKNHARELERENRPDPGVKVYELTVKNASEPGLPPPENWLGSTNFTASVDGKKSPPPFDPMLDESEHILLDYVSLLQKSGSVTANP